MNQLLKSLFAHAGLPTGGIFRTEAQVASDAADRGENADVLAKQANAGEAFNSNWYESTVSTSPTRVYRFKDGSLLSVDYASNMVISQEALDALIDKYEARLYGEAREKIEHAVHDVGGQIVDGKTIVPAGKEHELNKKIDDALTTTFPVLRGTLNLDVQHTPEEVAEINRAVHEAARVSKTATFAVEYTDTMAGEANYSWVERKKITLPADATDRSVVIAAKKALGLTGIKCDMDNAGDTITLRPRNSNTIVFITFEGED